MSSSFNQCSALLAVIASGLACFWGLLTPPSVDPPEVTLERFRTLMAAGRFDDAANMLEPPVQFKTVNAGWSWQLTAYPIDELGQRVHRPYLIHGGEFDWADRFAHGKWMETEYWFDTVDGATGEYSEVVLPCWILQTNRMCDQLRMSTRFTTVGNRVLIHIEEAFSLPTDFDLGEE